MQKYYKPAEILGFDVDHGWPIFKIAYASYKGLAVFRCPFCGRVHTHGDSDGNRAPHCPVPFKNNELLRLGYYLVKVDDWRRAGDLTRQQTTWFLRQDAEKSTQGQKHRGLKL